jgi:hypothetical protein
VTSPPAASSSATAPSEPYKSADGVWHTGDPGLDAFLNDHSFGFLGDIVEGVGDVLAPVAKELGGPLLAAAVTAIGFPQLAPLALEFGGALASTAVETLTSAVGTEGGGAAAPGEPAGGSAAEVPAGSGLPSLAAATSSSSSTSASTVEFDEKLEMLNLQRMVEKQNAMFAALSNTMRSLHDTQMTAIQNIR